MHRLFQRELEDWLEDAISSQIHQNVYLPEPLMDLGNGTLDFLGLPDIANYGKRLLFPPLLDGLRRSCGYSSKMSRQATCAPKSANLLADFQPKGTTCTGN